MGDVAATDVAVQTRRGISWNLAGAILTNVVRVIAVVVLGRHLDSGDFGVVAAALSVTVVFHNLRDLGIGPALVQRPKLDDAHVSTAFATQVYLGVSITAILFLGSSLIGGLYNIPESVAVIQALSVIFILRGFASTSLAMCQREMQFRAIAIIDLISYGVGTITAISLAVAGVGAWSLVFGYLVEELLSAVLYLALYRPPATLRIHWTCLRELLGFGLSQSVIQLGGILATNSDNYVVGGHLGKHALGYYSRAYDLIKFPSALFSNVVGNVLFSAFSRLQEDKPRLAAGYRRVIFVNSLVLFPVSGVLIVAAPEIIRLVMGPHWVDAVVPFQILAISMMFRTSYKAGAIVASVSGRVHQVAFANVVYLVAVISGSLLTVRFGLIGVAIATAASLGIMYVHCSALALRASGLPMSELVRAHVPGLLLGLLCGGVCWLVVAALRGDASFVVISVVAAAIGAALSLGAIVLLVRYGTGDFAWLGGELRRLRKQKSKE